LVINDQPGGATREWVMDNIGEARALFFRGHYNIDAELLNKGKMLKNSFNRYFSQEFEIHRYHCRWT
jgi:hypothetical protein